MDTSSPVSWSRQSSSTGPLRENSSMATADDEVTWKSSGPSRTRPSCSESDRSVQVSRENDAGTSTRMDPSGACLGSARGTNRASQNDRRALTDCRSNSALNCRPAYCARWLCLEGPPPEKDWAMLGSSVRPRCDRLPSRRSCRSKSKGKGERESYVCGYGR